MPGSKDKHHKICDLMLEAEYMTPLWYTLKQEGPPGWKMLGSVGIDLLDQIILKI